MRRSRTLYEATRRGSVLVIVMITLIFAAVALVAFIERAMTDLLVESRDTEARRLRQDAYSALETTLAVLADFREVGNGLHSVTEGWGDPLTFANWSPGEGRTVDIGFEDESGKLSLPQLTATHLTELFKAWQLTPAGADAPAGTPPPTDIPVYDPEELADALVGWMKANHTYATAITIDYDHAQLPYEEPGRSLRSFDELAAIDYVRDIFFGPDGRPNSLYYRFTSDVSLFRFPKPNLNSQKPDVLAALGKFDDTQKQKLSDYFAGTGQFSQQGPAWLTDLNTATTIVGKGGDPNLFTTTISALRISITVHEGAAQFRLVAVVAPLQNGASTIQATASSIRAQTASNTPGSSGSTTQPSNTPTASTNAKAASNAKKLNYPFTLLEIRENDEIPPAPPPPPAASA